MWILNWTKMAYNIADRFPLPPKYFKLLDPGAYQYESAGSTKENKAPFLTKAPRNTQAGLRVWTEAIYDASISHKIPNCTSLKSKKPRFPYEAFSEEDLEEILCKCGIPKPCNCEDDQDIQEIVCQGKVRRRMFKGPPPRAVSSDEGLSAPSKTDHGFEILPNGSKRRIREKILDESPPFYDARVYESTAFYQGCKWSQWTSKRSQKTIEERPSPAHYTLSKRLTETDICQEKVREHKRMTSKQPRFIEIIQQRNIAEGRPGPATYSPTSPKGTDLQYLGPKAERYQTLMYDVKPGPTDYFLRRDFDPPEVPEKSCHFRLPERACFGMKALRFKPRREEGPSPASYNAIYNPQFLNCSRAPFGTSCVRFKSNVLEENDDQASQNENYDETKQVCPDHTWEFKSKTIRIKPLVKKHDEPSPADLPQSAHNKIKKRSPKFQYLAPFCSSQGRFQPWYNWIPVQGKDKTPGPCYYDLEPPKCLPAVNHGPLYRAPRFPSYTTDTPAANEYKISGGIEIILRTHNRKLLDNIENQHKFHWEPRQDGEILSFEEKESRLLQKSIALLEVDDHSNKSGMSSSKHSELLETQKPKMLRCFVYSQRVKQ